MWPDASPTALIESADKDAWPGVAPEIDEYGDRAFSRVFGNHKWYARWVSRWLRHRERVKQVVV